MPRAAVSSPPHSPPATSGIIQEHRQVTPSKTQLPAHSFQGRGADLKGLPPTPASSHITPATGPLHKLAPPATWLPLSLSVSLSLAEAHIHTYHHIYEGLGSPQHFMHVSSSGQITWAG